MGSVGKRKRSFRHGIVDLRQREVGDLAPRTFAHRLGASEGGNQKNLEIEGRRRGAEATLENWRVLEDVRIRSEVGVRHGSKRELRDLVVAFFREGDNYPWIFGWYTGGVKSIHRSRSRELRNNEEEEKEEE